MNRPSLLPLRRGYAPFVGVCALGAVLALAPDPPKHRSAEAGALVLLLSDGPLGTPAVPTGAAPGRPGEPIIVDAATVEPVDIQGGLLLRPLYTDPDRGFSTSVVEWPADVPLRRHWHPVTERLFLLEGSILGAERAVPAGSFWEAPARVSMGPYLSTGSRFVFFGEGPFETHYLGSGVSAPRPGGPSTVDPDTIPWRPFSELAGGEAPGEVKLLARASGTERGVYLLRLHGGGASEPLAWRSGVEGYVLSGEVRLRELDGDGLPLAPGTYFRMPERVPFDLSATSP